MDQSERPIRSREELLDALQLLRLSGERHHLPCLAVLEWCLHNMDGVAFANLLTLLRRRHGQ
jgi:hypothetical protein